MKTKKTAGLLAGLALLLWAAQGPAQDAALADATAIGQTIARALNQREAEAMMRLLDLDAIGRLVLKDLSLSAADRESVRKGLPLALRGNLDLSLRGLETSKGSARFMRSAARDGRPYALVRFDLGDQGIDYVEYYLSPARKVEDWYVHSVALLYTTSARFDLATMLKTDSMLFGLFGTKLVTQADLKPFTELRSALAAQDFARAFRVLEDFPEGYRKSRQWALMRVSYGGRIDEQTHRAALRHLASSFGGDADLQFMLVDHYFFEKQFDRALNAVAALERNIGGEDAATGNLKGNLLIAMKRFDEASKACRRAMSLEPDHKPAYWCLVTVGLARKDGKTTIEGLTAYEKAFAVQFDPDRLGQQDAYKEIAGSPEFAAWARSRRR